MLGRLDAAAQVSAPAPVCRRSASRASRRDDCPPTMEHGSAFGAAPEAPARRAAAVAGSVNVNEG